MSTSVKLTVRVPMVSEGKRTIGEIEKKLPMEIRSRGVVRGRLIIDYVEDVVTFEVKTP